MPSFSHVKLITVAKIGLLISYWLFETHIDLFSLFKQIFSWVGKRGRGKEKRHSFSRFKASLGYFFQDEAVLSEGSLGLAALEPLTQALPAVRNWLHLLSFLLEEGTAQGWSENATMWLLTRDGLQLSYVENRGTSQFAFPWNIYSLGWTTHPMWVFHFCSSPSINKAEWPPLLDLNYLSSDKIALAKSEWVKWYE